MKTEQIIYLNDIAQTHSITQTAQRYFISQQALSSTIKKLEEEFNSIFLARTNKGVILTAEGEYFLEQAQNILETYAKIKDNFSYLTIAAPEVLQEGELHIFCHTRVLGVFLIDILEQFTKRYPNIKIILKEKENIDIIEAVSKKDCDLGIIFAPDFLLNENAQTSSQKDKHYHFLDNIHLQVLFSDSFIVCCSKQHPFANKETITDQDFNNTSLVLFDSHPAMSGEYKNCPQNHYKRFFSNNIQFHKDMILKGLAVSVITSFEFRKLYLKYKNLTVIPIKIPSSSNITLVTNLENTLSPQAQIFMQMLKHYDFYRI